MSVINYPVRFCLILASFICLFSAVFSVNIVEAANEGVIIAPTRLVFSERDRSQVIRLVNKDSVARRFRLSLFHMSMDDKGTRLETDTPDTEQILAQKMIRFSPRQVTIEPEGWQTVRVMVRKPKGLADGEYRTHLKFALIPDPEEKDISSRQESDSTKADTVGIKINIIMNVTIPLIVRHGQGNTQVTPQEVLFKKDERSGGQIMEVALNRTGSYSLFGDIALFDDSAKGEPLKLGEIKGIAIYTPNTVQYVPVPVTLEGGTNLHGKNVRVEVRNREDEKKPLLVSRVLPVL